MHVCRYDTYVIHAAVYSCTSEASGYVNSVLHSVITGALPPGHNNPYQQAPPPVADQLVCLNFLAQGDGFGV